MALSNSFDYAVTGLDIVKEALEITGNYDPGETLSAADSSSCIRTLNMMMKTMAADNFYVWKQVNGVMFLEYEEKEYSIGPSGDNASTTYVKTELSVAGVATDLTITVDDDDGMTNGDYIGIELDDKTIQWTTINGVPAANVVTITVALTGAAAVDNHVYTYTNLIQRPLEITEARLRNANGIERPIDIVSRKEYMLMSDKDSTGTINQIYYEPTLTNGKIYTWPACGNAQEVIKFTAKIPIQDFDSTTNNPDCPQEWFLPLAWNLAPLIAPKYGEGVSKDFLFQAERLKQSAMSLDIEHESIFFGTK